MLDSIHQANNLIVLSKWYLSIFGWVNFDNIFASLIFLISGVIGVFEAVVENTEKKSSWVACNLL